MVNLNRPGMARITQFVFHSGPLGFSQKETAMADFNELLNMAKSGGDDVPETIYDDLSHAYQTTVDGSMAALAARQEALDKAAAEITRLKAMNFELMMRSPAQEVDDNDDKTDNESKTRTPLGINGLFRIG